MKEPKLNYKLIKLPSVLDRVNKNLVGSFEWPTKDQLKSLAADPKVRITKIETWADNQSCNMNTMKIFLSNGVSSPLGSSNRKLNKANTLLIDG